MVNVSARSSLRQPRQVLPRPPVAHPIHCRGI
jgi:hypothetical protein